MGDTAQVTPDLIGHDISSEEFREYIYSDGNVLLIEKPVSLFITGSGSHRVVTADGRCYRPTPGYLAISWKQSNGLAFDF